jgi:hypothetical protein
MSDIVQTKFFTRLGVSGYPYFGKAQTDNRFALCKESLLYEGGIILRFKKIYSSLRDIELCSITDFDSVDELSERYKKLDSLGYGGEFEKYDKSYSPEGALYPFLRVRGRRKYEFIDSGCIWIGTKFKYPLIFVNNDIANWISPYSPGGLVRKEPFLPYFKIREIMPRLMNQNRYADLDVDGLV